jgi:thioredoxin-related protein
MKKLLMAVAIGCVWLQTQAADLNWGTDLPKALAQAKADKKMVLLDFTGSDWCIWCHRLNDEIFSKPEFAEYAGKNLVLVEVDFPRKKPLSEAQKRANTALAGKYKIKGYPTILLLDGDGRTVGQTGYVRGGPGPFLAELEKLKSK